LGFQAQNVVFDSPAKTRSEIRLALQRGYHLNVDNFSELEEVSSVIRGLSEEEKAKVGPIGLRINPLVGRGAAQETANLEL
jgi:diaminopimelate decarboxylase